MLLLFSRLPFSYLSFFTPPFRDEWLELGSPRLAPLGTHTRDSQWEGELGQQGGKQQRRKAGKRGDKDKVLDGRSVLWYKAGAPLTRGPASAVGVAGSEEGAEEEESGVWESVSEHEEEEKVEKEEDGKEQQQDAAAGGKGWATPGGSEKGRGRPAYHCQKREVCLLLEAAYGHFLAGASDEPFR